MTIQRNNEIKAVVTALTVAAAVASGLLMVQDANAAPPTKKSTVTVKRAKKGKPVYVKMTGNRRAAETRARSLYAAAIAQKEADAQAVIDARNAATAAAEANAAPAAPSGADYAAAGLPAPYVGFQQPINNPNFPNAGTVVVGGGYAPIGFGGNNYGIPQGYNNFGGGLFSPGGGGGFGFPVATGFGYPVGGFSNGSGIYPGF